MRTSIAHKLNQRVECSWSLKVEVQFREFSLRRLHRRARPLHQPLSFQVLDHVRNESLSSMIGNSVESADRISRDCRFQDGRLKHATYTMPIQVSERRALELTNFGAQISMTLTMNWDMLWTVLLYGVMKTLECRSTMIHVVRTVGTLFVTSHPAVETYPRFWLNCCCIQLPNWLCSGLAIDLQIHVEHRPAETRRRAPAHADAARGTRARLWKQQPRLLRW